MQVKPKQRGKKNVLVKLCVFPVLSLNVSCSLSIEQSYLKFTFDDNEEEEEEEKIANTQAHYVGNTVIGLDWTGRSTTVEQTTIFDENTCRMVCVRECQPYHHHHHHQLNQTR